MNKQELIEKYELELKDVQLKFGASFKTKVYEELLEDLKQLDEPQPIKLKNVTARIKQLDIGTRKVWLDEFLNELGSDYGTLKYKAGYEQGKFDGAVEREKVQVPQFVADWIDNMKCQGKTLYYGLDHTPPEEVDLWFCEDEVNRQNTFARAWLDGYEIQGRKYVVTDGNHLYFKGYQEDVDIVILVDDQPGTIDYVKKFDTREEAQKVADILGWKVQEVQDDSKI
nr:MAG TPA: Protein of unknown function (DUF1642) [Caudoviricetes sp.]